MKKTIKAAAFAVFLPVLLAAGAWAAASNIPSGVPAAPAIAATAAAPAGVSPAASVPVTFTASGMTGSAPAFVTASAGAGLSGTSAASVTQNAAASATSTAATLQPLNLLPDVSGVTKIKMSWVENFPGTVHFNIFRRKPKTDFARLNADAFSNTFYVDARIVTATAYEYQVQAIDAKGNSAMSDIKPVSSAGLVLPQKPYTFKGFQDVENVLLKWSAGTKGSFEISGYNIYRGKTADKMEFLKFMPATATHFGDDTVEAAVKYYYKMNTIDAGGYESEFTDTEVVIPFPRPRTGLILNPTAFRNNIFDNTGLNADFLFTYYIGSITSEYNLGAGAGEETHTLNPLSVILFTGDVKGTIFNEFEDWPSLGAGALFTLLMQYNLGSSDASTATATIKGKQNITKMYGFYAVMSKKIAWDTTLHLGGMSGLGKPGEAPTDYMHYLSPILTEDNTSTGGKYVQPSNYSYYLGFGRPLFGKLDLKVEYTVPVEANTGPHSSALLPNYYLINTHIENFIRFDVSYFHYPTGCAVLGYISFRFAIYPNPYK